MRDKKDNDFPLNVLVICPKTLYFINFNSIPHNAQYEFNFFEASIELSRLIQPFDILA